MGNHENSEALKAADQIKEDKNCNLNAYITERPMPNCQSGRDKGGDLVNQGILPAFDLMDSSSYRKGPIAKQEELKESGVKVTITPDGDKIATYPSGVEVASGKHDVQVNGKKIETESIGVIPKSPNHFNKNGSQILDRTGKIIAQRNEDESWTVDSGKGFYTQHQDGTIERNSAIRSRDGKTFEVLDTESPLGNLRPGDMIKHK